jgi:chemotaxis protein methyltransferase CheR
MQPQVYDRYRKLIYDSAGITLAEGKQTLLESRLAKRLRELRLASHDQYLDRVESDPSGEELVMMLDLVSTNVTHFYRESEHFAVLRKHFRAGLDRGQTRFRFWSAASSSGEEPFSMAIALLEESGGRCPDTRILATDISTRMLDRCRQAIYHRDQLREVPGPLQKKYFQPGAAPETVRVVDGPRRLVTFKRLNLATPPFPMSGPLDVVFCRNVMIYFDQTVRLRLVDEIHRMLRPGGLLMISHSESLLSLKTPFKMIAPSVYLKEGA